MDHKTERNNILYPISYILCDSGDSGRGEEREENTVERIGGVQLVQRKRRGE